MAIKPGARRPDSEAIFLIRAYRTTLACPRRKSRPLEYLGHGLRSGASQATFKDAAGRARSLGPTFDYTHRLLDFALAADAAGRARALSEPTRAETGGRTPKRRGYGNRRVLDLPGPGKGLIEPAAARFWLAAKPAPDRIRKRPESATASPRPAGPHAGAMRPPDLTRVPLETAEASPPPCALQASRGGRRGVSPRRLPPPQRGLTRRRPQAFVGS